MACLADIPELSTGSAGSGGAGGSATTTTAPSSTATSFCDELGAMVDFCADFDGPGGVAEGWVVTEDLSTEAHIELDTSERSPPSSAHIWVEDSAEPCSYAQLIRSVPEVASDPAFNFNLDFLSQITGIFAELNWVRGSVECQVLVYLNDDNIVLSLRDKKEVVPTTGVTVPIPGPPYRSWHNFRVHVDRAKRGFAFEYDGMEAFPTNMPAESWLAACADPVPEPGSMIDVKIGSYCVVAGNDMANDNHYDNVTFAFE